MDRYLRSNTDHCRGIPSIVGLRGSAEASSRTQGQAVGTLVKAVRRNYDRVPGRFEGVEPGFYMQLPKIEAAIFNSNAPQTPGTMPDGKGYTGGTSWHSL